MEAKAAERAGSLRRLLEGGPAEREQACAALAAAAASDFAPQAEGATELKQMLAMVVPAFAPLLAADVSVIGPAEFRRMSYLLLDLVMIDRRIQGEYIRMWPVIMAANGTCNAVVACLEKPAAELTREEMLTVSCHDSLIAAMWARGVAAILDAIDSPPTELEVVGTTMTQLLLPGTTHSRGQVPDAQALELARRGLALLRAEPDLGYAEASGLFWTLFVCGFNRPAIGQLLFEEAMPVAMAALNRASPSEWLTATKGRFLFNGVFGLVKDSAAAAVVANGPEAVVPLLLSSGYLAALVQMLELFKAECGEASFAKTAGMSLNKMSFFYCVCWGAADLDFSVDPEAYQLIRGAASSIRFALDHNVEQLREIGGWQSRVWLCILAANLFGKDEDGGPLELLQVATFFLCMQLLSVFPQRLTKTIGLHSLNVVPIIRRTSTRS